MSYPTDYYLLGNSNYNRSKTVAVLYATCDKCKTENTIVIATDTSDGEYGDLYICMDCINEIYDKFISKFKNIKKSIQNDEK